MDILPRELVDAVFGNLHDLHACSLTCRAWNLATRRHIFNSVKIRTKSQFMSLEKTFAQYAHVKRLTLFPVCYMSIVFAVPCWPRFNHITNLSLMAFKVTDLDDSLQPFFKNFTSLQSLTMIHSQFFSLNAVMKIIHSLPRLNMLRLDRVRWETNRNRLDPPIAVSDFSLRALYLSRLDVTEFLDYLLELHPKLHLWVFQVGSGRSFNRLLTSCQHSLRMLDLQTLGKYIHPPSYNNYLTNRTEKLDLTTLDLSQCKSLHSLVLPTTNSHFSPQTIQQIPSKDFAEVFIFITWQLAHDMDSDSDWDFPWLELEDVLVQPQFQNVRLRAGEPDPDNMDDIQKSLHKVMPMASSRGMISVENSSKFFLNHLQHEYFQYVFF